MYRKTGLLGSGGAMQRREARLDEWNWRVPKRGWNLHRMHDAGFSGQVHAVYEPAAGFAAVFQRGDDVWPGNSRVAAVHTGVIEQRAVLETADGGVMTHEECKTVRTCVLSVG